MKLTHLLVGATLWTSLTAQAENKADIAKAQFKRGMEFYEQSNFRGALAEFERAYELAPSYKMLFNIGQVDMELQDFAGAFKAFTRYIREGGGEIPAARREQVAAELDKLKLRVGQITVDAAPGAEVLIDDIAVGYIPLPEAVPVNAGRHRATIHSAGSEQVNRVVDVAGEQLVTIAIPWERAAPGAVGGVAGAAAPPSKTGMYVAWTVTGVVGVTSGVFAGLAVKASSDLNALRASYPVSSQALSTQANKTNNLSIVADATAVAAIASGALALYWTLTAPASSPSKVSLLLQAGPTSVGLAGTF